ncbi:MAG: hypothetical protein IJK46_01525 [Prevotella sp.]|nr:hypothetical protein [Prevotella sp.]
MENRTNYRIFLLLTWMALNTCLCTAQVTLEQNMYQAHDLLERQQMNPSSIRECSDALADLQKIEAIGENNLEHMEWGTDSLIAIDNGGMQKYRLKGNSLLLTGTENRLMHIDYSLPETWLRFPMSLGDSISGLFEGKGQYCERLFIRKAGRYTTKADALGSLVMENSDTLHNVLRLKTERITTTLAQPLDSMLGLYGILDSIPILGNDSILSLMTTDIKAVRTVIMRYYVPGCRYPVLETCEAGSVAENGSPNQFTAFYSSPYSQSCLASANRSMPAKSSGGQRSLLPDEKTGNNFSYSIDMNTSARTINVNCCISGETVDGILPVRLLLCDQQGILYRQASGSLQPGEPNQLSINYAGLRHGPYVLHIEACGQQYSEKFSVN